MDVPVDPCECDGAASEPHNADKDKTKSPTIPPSILELKNGLKEDGTMQFAFPDFSNNRARACVCVQLE